MLARILPTLDRAELLIDDATRLPPQLEARRADGDRGIGRDRRRDRDTRAVQEGSVGRVEILDEVNEEEECGAEEASEFRERLDGRPELHSL